MVRVFPVLITVAACGGIVLGVEMAADGSAEPSQPPSKAKVDKSTPNKSDKVDQPTQNKLYKEVTLELTVSPAKLPTPPLRYRLLPPRETLTPGNRAIDYLRAIAALPQPPTDERQLKQWADTQNRILDTPLAQIPIRELWDYLQPHAATLQAIDHARRRNRCDWQFDDYVRADNTPIIKWEEVGKPRYLMHLLRVRYHIHTTERNFDAAFHDLQSMVLLAKDVGESPTLIRMLVGLAIAHLTFQAVEHWLEQPDRPSLYAAMLDLPQPFIDPRPGVEGEFRHIGRSLPQPSEVLGQPMAEAEALRQLQRMHESLCQQAEPLPAARMVQLPMLAAYVAQAGPDARKELVAMGWPAEQVQRLSNAQAVAARTVAWMQTIHDELLLAFRSPRGFDARHWQRIEQHVEKMKRSGDPILAVFALSVPAFQRTHLAHLQVERRWAMLRIVEALRLHAAEHNGQLNMAKIVNIWKMRLRLHAAEHNGQLPAQLQELAYAVPLTDPMLGRPFEYQPTANGFVLSAPPGPAQPGSAIRYVVRWRQP